MEEKYFNFQIIFLLLIFFCILRYFHFVFVDFIFSINSDIQYDINIEYP